MIVDGAEKYQKETGFESKYLIQIFVDEFLSLSCNGYITEADWLLAHVIKHATDYQKVCDCGIKPDHPRRGGPWQMLIDAIYADKAGARVVAQNAIDYDRTGKLPRSWTEPCG